ncbi:APC family permease [Actinomycetospora termitidis]|uniref:APC family permease n=1 Tax=Actinomycetospora termitidis TaxID=3053470 RepID=A0ABT7MFS1_9PSEU|nr:APC family permease [Actinomycetospora sp. Odt1-22]MDL5159514.1 APC family permease [Actinomycetospora sp. Odt1-22]
MRTTRGIPGLRARSPVAGLRRRTLGPLGVLAQSVATTAPAGAMAAVPLLVTTAAGRGAPWSVAIAAALVGLVVASIAVFARRMAAAGGLYSFTAKGLGPGGAYACAVSMVLGYGLLVAAALVGASWYARALVERLWPVDTTAVGVAVVVVLSGAIAACAVRGVRLAGRVMLVVEGVSITLILAVLVTLAVRAPAGPAAPLPPVGAAGIVAGVLPAVAAFIGFDSATALGVEARRPFASVPRAVAVTAGGAALLYLVAMLVHLAAPTVLPALTVAAPDGGPGAAVIGDWAPLLLDAGIIASFGACTLAALNTLVRVLFSLAREGVAPAVLGRTHRRHHTPAVAVGLAVPLLALPPVVGTLAGVEPQDLLGGLLALATVGFLAAYLLVCLAAPRFLRRIGELTPAVVVVAWVAVPVLAVVIVVALVRPGGVLLPVTVGLVVLAAVAGWVALRRTHAAELDGMGVYDETTASDLHLASRGGG